MASAPHRPIEPWMTNAPGPFMTLRPGGPFDDVFVAISVAAETRLLVEASWNINGDPGSTSQTVDGYDAARRLAHAWADLLVIGREPEPT
jgi:hypothetical protein